MAGQRGHFSRDAFYPILKFIQVAFQRFYLLLNRPGDLWQDNLHKPVFAQGLSQGILGFRQTGCQYPHGLFSSLGAAPLLPIADGFDSSGNHFFPSRQGGHFSCPGQGHQILPGNTAEHHPVVPKTPQFIDSNRKSFQRR
ncbi:MAG: hypothetical protein BWX80_03789 [Candidatus Hydrogenedentes bacterium ADurb.Bin101]|nr:MAG: hypothetical protein BWX80_03789 [Candidatus Hydrogenedentes bacterium ADurb.Bin101]